MTRLARYPRLLLLAFLLLLLASTASVRAAADKAAAPAAESNDTPPARKAPDSLLQLIVAGGPINIGFISVLCLFSLVALAVILERLVNLTERKLIPPDFVHGLRELIRRQEDSPQPFQTLCDRFPSLIANILKAGLLRAGRPLAEVEKGMEDAAARELGDLRGSVRPLTVLSAVGPLVGLLGTAVGMILVFRTASTAGPGKAELLAEGIYLKLEVTVCGLIVAIPSVLFAALFNHRSEKLLRRADEILTETIPCFVRMEQNAERPLAALREKSW